MIFTFQACDIAMGAGQFALIGRAAGADPDQLGEDEARLLMEAQCFSGVLRIALYFADEVTRVGQLVLIIGLSGVRLR